MTRHSLEILVGAGLLFGSLTACKPPGGDSQPSSSTTGGAEDTTSAVLDTEGECPGVPSPECGEDMMCPEGELCSGCLCVPIPDDCGDNAECVSDAECGSDSACIDCLCVHECSLLPLAGCTSHEDCEGTTICAGAPGCECVEDLGCTEEDECRSNFDCDGTTCHPVSCTCDGIGCACTSNEECGDGMVCQACECITPPGESDPEGDCERDFEPPEACNPAIDIVATEVGCDGDALTVSVTYAEPIDPEPGVQTTRALELWDDADNYVLRMFASASQFEPGPYECEIIVVGQMAAPLGPDDVCQISEDGNRFEYRLSAESAMLAGAPLGAVAAYAQNSDPSYHFDMTDSYPFPCP
ncbi:MAG: hypothetical protein AAF799_20315 [Myxococcota bacterium]